jgi:hypothetical protein
MKVYHITIAYDKEEGQWEYLCETEEILEGSKEYDELETRGYVNLAEYFDEEGLELITGCYIMGEA